MALAGAPSRWRTQRRCARSWERWTLSGSRSAGEGDSTSSCTASKGRRGDPLERRCCCPYDGHSVCMAQTSARTIRLLRRRDDTTCQQLEFLFADLTFRSAELKEATTGRSASSTVTPTSANTPQPPASPNPSTSDSSGPPVPRSGLLTIRVVEARKLTLPQGVNLPAGIRDAVEQAQGAYARGGRESLQRKQMWWLP